jgi:hypothetical protein
MPYGMYWNAACPFLSICGAVSCGARSERAKFSVGHDYYQFCLYGYGLSHAQTTVLLAAQQNAPGPDYACVPTPAQLDAIIQELQNELQNKPQGTPAVPAPPTLDPLLSTMFPTLIELYKYYILGQAPAPHSNWPHKIKKEWTPELPWIW